MKIVYFDCFSGISGDMVLGAVVDAGVDPEELTTELSKLNLDGEFHLSFEKSTKHDITGTKALVETYEDTHRDDHNHHHKHTHGPSRLLSDIFSIIDASQLQSNLCDKVKQIFDRLAEAEAKVHNKEKSKVHLHEVSGIDSIVDIVGSVIGLDLLGIEKVYASPISLGRGFVRCAHGMMPVPVPGTMETIARYSHPTDRYPKRISYAYRCSYNHDRCWRFWCNAKYDHGKQLVTDQGQEI